MGLMTLKAIVPCRPVDDAKLTWLPPWLQSFPAPQVDATVMTCTDCGIEIWVGPRGKAAVDSGSGMVVCYLCARPHLARADAFSIPRGIPDRPRRSE
jgi:hypothetical protein